MWTGVVGRTSEVSGEESDKTTDLSSEARRPEAGVALRTAAE